MDIAQINRIIQDYDSTLAYNKINTPAGDPNKRDVAYITKTDALRAAQDSLMSQTYDDGSRHFGQSVNPKGSLISNRPSTYNKNDKAETGSCNVACVTF